MKVKLINSVLMLWAVLLVSNTFGYTSPTQKVLLAKNERAFYTIVLSSNPTPTQKFAGAELKKYLQRISHADFTISSNQEIKGEAIFLKKSDGQEEGYSISIRDKDIVLAGNSDRSVLYAVYDFLHRLGCRWIAPEFSFYNGEAEHIPDKPALFYEASEDVYEQPVFTYRKLDVDQGRSHNVENLKKLINWMPKLRFNTLQIPLDYRGNGNVQWEKWSEELTPELEKRGLMIEVGGHGYENFLNANMEDGQLFNKHPEWFGKDSTCQPSPSKHLVFNTRNSEAVQYFIQNVINYLQEHPEIDIFDFWPPDVARWSECPEWENFGPPADRQAKLVNEVLSEVRKIRPDLRLQIIAYAKALLPPEEVNLDKDILVDFCPIDQNFEKQIYDSSSVNNSNYLKAIHSWRTKFKGEIGIYSYYRKYAWRSLPNVIPYYIQGDLQFYAGISLQGISIYSEPADWGTYELNHYILGKVAWNPQADLGSLMNNFAKVRYGTFWKSAKDAYESLENTVRNYGSIPFTDLKSQEKIEQSLQRVHQQLSELEELKELSDDEIVSANISRLLLMLKYAYLDLQIQKDRALDDVTDEIIYEKVEKLVSFLENNHNKGMFLLSDQNNLARYINHYNLN
jgi:hypothetical protein